MKLHTTNYLNTFIEIAADCPIFTSQIPPLKDKAKTIANLQFELIYNNPYKFTSDDVLFEVFAIKNDLSKKEYKTEREKYFSKGQPCFRASPLTKRYGWGIHNDREGKIAIFGAETKEYKQFVKDTSLKVVKAMKSSK